MFRPAKVACHPGAGQERMRRGRIELSGDWPCLCDVTRAVGGGGAGQGEARRRSSPSPEKPCGLRYIPVWGGASPGPSHNLTLPARPRSQPGQKPGSLLPTHLWPPDNSLLANSRRTPWSPRSGEHGLWGSRGGRALGPGGSSARGAHGPHGPLAPEDAPCGLVLRLGAVQPARPPAPGLGAWGLRTCSQRYGDMETECPPDARRPHPQPTRKGRGCR